MDKDNQTGIMSAILAVAEAIKSKNESLETEWIDMDYENSWENYNSGNVVGSYKRDANGMVFLRGLVKNGTGIRICYLPEGFRPIEQYICAGVTSSSVFCRISIDPDGTVEAVGYSSSYVSVSGIFFQAEQ